MAHGHKERMFEKLSNEPRDFSIGDIDRLRTLDDFSAGDVHPMLLDIFDMRDGFIPNGSVASKGVLGFFNRLSRFRRNRKFEKRMKKPGVGTVIVAEGDSWFEHPVKIKDIVDHLINIPSYAVYSLAFAGDWISNILSEHEYLDALVRINPDVFMVSGGGNDILDNKRLARLVHRRSRIDAAGGYDLDTPEGKQGFADECLNNRFFLLMKLFSLLYRHLYHSIARKHEKFSKLKIITQGYDYGVPSTKKGFSLLRWFENNGCWLHEPLTMRGYDDGKEQRAIIFGMINHFNEMLIETGADLPGVIHMDLRGSVERYGKWFDEIHPTSKTFGKIAEAFKICIESEDVSRKVFTAREMDLP